MTFDPECYSISVKKEDHDGEVFFVGRVAEFPNISVFEETFQSAYLLIIDAISSLKAIADTKGSTLPQPFICSEEDFSGRITLRLPKSLHAKAYRLAEQDNSSFNQYLVTAIATYVGEADGIARIVDHVSHRLMSDILGGIASVWRMVTYSLEDSRTPTTVAVAETFDDNVKYLQATKLQMIGN